MSLPRTLPLPPSLATQTGSGCIVLVDVKDARAAPEALQAAFEALPDDERALCARWAPRRQATFAAGRVALRAALRAALPEAVVVAEGLVIGRDDRGAPVLPATLPRGLRVSITHKDTIAGALVVTDADDDLTVGVDLELDDGRPRDAIDALARQVFLPAELARLPDDDAARRRALFERFSLKEALYKALDPFLRRYIGFTEVTVDLDEGVRFSGDFFARDGVVVAEGGIVTVPGLPTVVLTTAQVRRRRP